MSRRSALAFALALALWPGSADAHLNSTGMGPLYDGAVHFFDESGATSSARSRSRCSRA